MSVVALSADPFDARIALRASGLLREFNAALVLSAADVHVAQRLADAAGETGEPVRLAAALAVRGPRLGHVFVDLATIADTASVESEEPVDLSALPWPAQAEWLAAVQQSTLVAVGDEASETDRPLRLRGGPRYRDR
jgi:exodeoxyribonuclease V alpha subunit